MPLLYKTIKSNGSIEYQYTSKVPACLSIFHISGIRLHPCHTKITISPTLLGGKGAFRQLMRNVGRTTTKSANQSMARDLNGRRLRDVENERRLQEFVEKSTEREQQNDVERLQKLERMANIKNSENQRKNYLDADFDEKSKIMEESMNAAVEVSYNCKRKIESKRDVAIKKQKIGKFGLDEDDLSDLSTDDEESVDPISSGKEEGLDTVKRMEENLAADESDFFVVRQKFEKVKTPKVDYQEKVVSYDPIDLDAVADVEVLKLFGLDHLKWDLQRRGLKCGGTVDQRAARLYSIKGLKPKEIPSNLKTK